MNSQTLMEFGKELLHYGCIFTKDDFSTVDGFVTIRVIHYKSGLYYTKQVNGVFADIRLLKHPV